MQAYLLSSKDLSDRVYQSLYTIRTEDNFHFRSLPQSCPEESNPVYLDISQTPNTVEDKQDIWPENTVIGNTLWNPYELGSFPRIFQCVCVVHAFLKEAVPFSSEILDLLFNLTRDVRSLIMPTFSIKSFRLASSTIPRCVSTTDLMHFLPEPLPTFALGDSSRVWTCDLLFIWQTLYLWAIKSVGSRRAVGIVL